MKKFVLCLLMTLLLLPFTNGIAKPLTSLSKTLSTGVVEVVSSTLRPGDMWKISPPAGICTGFILDNQGHIVTVADLVADQHAIEIVLHNGHRWPARFMGSDPVTGLCVLELQAPKKVLKALRPLAMGTMKSVKPGSQIFTISMPFGSRFAVSKGIVTTIRSPLTTARGDLVDTVIQTDIALAPAWCGGPLADMSGLVIGITTNIFEPGTRPYGSGYAIPSDILTWVATQIISKGKVERAWMGITLQSITSALARILDLPVTQGVMIIGLSPNGPAAKAGLKKADREICLGNQIYATGGDIILAIDGKTIQTDGDFLSTLRKKSPGDQVKLTILRGDTKKIITVTLQEEPLR